MLSDFHYRLRALFRRKSVESEMGEELRAHLERQTEKYIRSGMPPAEAARRARIEFGGLEGVKEEVRDARGVGFIETTVRDVRHGLRMMAKNPGFASTAIPILTLGICASVSIFAFVDAALIKPLPYKNPSRLVGAYETIGMIARSNLSYQDYLDWKKMNKVFSSLEVRFTTGFLLKTPEGTEPVPGVRVSGGFFRTLGVRPALGRDFLPEGDSPGAATVILSYGAWQKRFGGSRDVIGRTISLSGVSHAIIGVLPQSFQFAPRGGAEFWTTIHPLNGCEKRRSCHNLYGVARLKDGVTVQSADASMKLIAAELEKQYPDSNRGQGAAIVSLSDAIVGRVRPILLTLLGAATLLLLIASVNVTSLLLARSESRKREIAVRSALGASSARLFRQFAAEGLVLAGAGGLLGFISAEWVTQLLFKLIPADMAATMPYLNGIGLNSRTTAFALAISFFAALWFAVTPTFRFSLSRLREGLAEGGRGSSGTLWRRFGPNLVTVELAIAVVLLVGAGLLGKSLYRLLRVDLGFVPDHLATLQVYAADARYRNHEEAARLGRQILNKVASLPGAKAAGLVDRLPVSGNGNTDWIRFVGRPYSGEHNEVNMRDVSPGYFTTVQAKLLRGRFFTDEDDASRPGVAIINQALANKYFPGEDPIGQKIGDTQLSPKSIREIVGVVDNVREGSLDEETWPAEYLPFAQSSDTYFSVIVRTSQSAGPLLPAMGTAIHQLDPGLGTFGQATMNERIHDSPAAYTHRISAWLVGGFAALALLLSVVGLYGMIAYSVSRRTREIGVRIALGAQRRTVYRLIMGQAVWLAGVGIAAGLVCSVGVATFMHGVLFGTQAWDVPTLAAVALLLAVFALLASYLPARRAAKVEPVVALRCE
jgi:predicted permease